MFFVINQMDKDGSKVIDVRDMTHKPVLCVPYIDKIYRTKLLITYIF